MVDAAHRKHMKGDSRHRLNHMGQIFFYDISGDGQPGEATSRERDHVQA
jgi:hypothetical protein